MVSTLLPIQTALRLTRDRLESPNLPSADVIRTLVNHYFLNVHPLRCFAFIHKPTFLQKLEIDLASSTAYSPLLHIICALGAQ